MRPGRALIGLAALGLVGAAAAQVPVGVADPGPVIDGFIATCQHGFPVEQQVAAAATAAGFTERQTYIPNDSSLPAGTVLPRMFQRGEAMMSLGHSGATTNHAPDCQVNAMAVGKPDPRAFASIVQQRLALAAPRWAGKGDDLHADWLLPGGMTLTAQISRYRSVRSYSLRLIKYQESPAG